MKSTIVFLIALMATSIIGYLLETFKIKYSMHKMKIANRYFVMNIKELIKNDKDANIFLVNNIRNFIKEQFLKKNIIDRYDIYKIDKNNIYIRFYKDKVLDNLNLYIDEELFNLSELSIICEDEVLD